MSHRRAIAAVLTVMLLTAVHASAQQNPNAAARRPFRGIFGAPAAPDSAHSLSLSGSIFGAYSVNNLDEPPDQQTNTPWLQQSGSHQGANLGLNYSFAKTLERFGFNGHAGGGVNYFRRGSRSRVMPWNRADVSLNGRATKSLTVSARQSVSYSSNYNPSLMPRLGEDIGHDIGLADDDTLDLFQLRALRLTSSLGVAQAFGRYTSLSAGYHYRSLHVLDADDAAASRFHDNGTHAATLRFAYSRPISRHASLILGYGARASDHQNGSTDPRILHNVDAGVNYSRALSFSRRTSFTFGTGSAIATTDRVDLPGTDPRTRVRLIGNAALTHEIGRSWTAQLAYTRGYRTLDGFDGLYFTDAAHVNVGGLLSRRLSFSASGAWADSSIENGFGGRHRGVSAHAITHYALTSYAALYATYVYYRYRFSDDILLDPRLPRRLNRQVVRVGLTASVPLIR
jgi:hypothetical protein